MRSCPLVFLHGFLGTKEDWKPICSQLPFECVALDLPGHGDAPFSETLAIDIPRFHLIGYSMGGRIALAYAHQHPEKIASLTLLSTHFGLSTESEKQQRLAHDAKWAELLETDYDEFIHQWYQQAIFNGFKPYRKKHNISALKAAFLHFSLGRQQRYEPKKALIMVGEHDEKFRQLHPEAIVIPDAGHAIHLQNPLTVAEQLLKEILEPILIKSFSRFSGSFESIFN